MESLGSKYYATLRRRALDQVEGYGHTSGGNGRGKGKPSQGKLNQ